MFYKFQVELLIIASDEHPLIDKEAENIPVQLADVRQRTDGRLFAPKL